MKEGRIEKRQCKIFFFFKKGKNIRREAGKGSNAKPVESERRHWGNQKSSEPVCVVCVHVCIYVRCTLTSTILSKQKTK